MVWDFLSALGGVGMFLVGMTLLTSGLKGLASDRLRGILARSTRTPLGGVATGALATAVVQSSSATTVAAVGFVAAGLLTFAQALGIIFGANIGTTLTGWMVALLGFKLDLGEAMLPVLFVAALLQLSGRRGLDLIGRALAGFSLLFIGIGLMQSGFAAFQGVVTPTDFPSDGLLGRLALVGIGILITIVTQSSSAGVAAALAALGAGAINLPQAAALVIGMDVGTTFTALLATLGGGTMARRTGLAHVIYNILTGIVAFCLLGPFTTLAVLWVPDGTGQVLLVAFHSFFNILGVVLVLPVVRPFARLIEWIVPERGSPLTRGLDPAVLAEPAMAIGLAVSTLDLINTALCDYLGHAIGGPQPVYRKVHDRRELEAALTDLRTYVDRIRLPKDDVRLREASASIFHSLDHMFRLLYRCDQSRQIAALGTDRRLRRLRGVFAALVAEQAQPTDTVTMERRLDRLRTLMRDQRKAPRDRIIRAAVEGQVSDDVALAQMDALRWLHRTSYHLWRIRVHQSALHAAPAVPPHDEARIDVSQD